MRKKLRKISPDLMPTERKHSARIRPRTAILDLFATGTFSSPRSRDEKTSNWATRFNFRSFAISTCGLMNWKKRFANPA